MSHERIARSVTTLDPLRRALAVIMVALLATFGMTATASATVSTSVSGWKTDFEPAPVWYTFKVPVKVKTGSSYVKRSVRVQRAHEDSSTWTTVASASTSSTGAYTASLTVPSVARWKFRLVVLATSTAAGYITPTAWIYGITGWPTTVSGWSTTTASAAVGYTFSVPIRVKTDTFYMFRSVRVERAVYGSTAWTAVTTVMTDGNGYVRVPLTVPATGRWWFRIYVPPIITTAHYTSPWREIIGITGLPTTVSGWSTTATTIDTPGVVKDSVTVKTGSGQVTRSVQMQRKAAASSTWSTVASVTTTSAGSATVSLPVSATGVWQYRLHIMPSTTAASYTSPVRQVTGVRMVKVKTTSLPAGDVGSAYSATLAGVYGVPPYTWTASGLPAGLTVDAATGVISGTPSSNGLSTVSLRVTDHAGFSATARIILAVEGGTGATSVKQVVSDGASSFCAVLNAGGVKCWGYNLYGDLGNGTATNSAVPTQVVGLTTGVASVTGAGFGYCALLTSGGVKCWGYNYSGELGDGTTTNSSVPVQVVGLTSGVASLVSDSSDSWGGGYCALLTSGGVNCWGYDQTGDLGDGTTTYSSVPVQVVGLTSGVTSVASDGHGYCAIVGSGGVRCWGDNRFGELGDGSTAQSSVPVRVTGLTSVSSLTGGLFGYCAVLTGGVAQCWGNNGGGQLGSGSSISYSSVPVQVAGLTSGVASVASDDSGYCARLVTGSARCWGYNGYGQLGNGSTTTSRVPVQVTDLTSGVTQLSAGGGGYCALLATGGVKCWGYNNFADLGNGTTSNSSVPTQVVGLTSGVTRVTSDSVDGGGDTRCALMGTAGVECWGDNYGGELGNGSTVAWSTVPVIVDGLN